MACTLFGCLFIKCRTTLREKIGVYRRSAKDKKQTSVHPKYRSLGKVRKSQEVSKSTEKYQKVRKSTPALAFDWKG